MTVEDVQFRVEEIRRMAGDGESAHGLEDDLWEDVLEAIAGGAENARHLATAALCTRSISFSRWYA